MTNMTTRARSRRLTECSAIFLIVSMGAVLRFWSIWHDYPYSFFGDEIHFVKRALAFGSGDFNPHWFHKPAFYMYLLFFEYGLFYIVGLLFDMWESVNEFAVYYISNSGPFYVIGRCTTALFSVGIIYLTYESAKRLFNRRVALFSALLICLSAGMVRVAKDVKADTPCAFFTLASCLFLVRFVQEQKMRYLLISCAIAGIGTATKYYTIVMLIPILASIPIVFMVTRKDLPRVLKLFIISIITFYGFYFVGTPYNFLDPLGRQTTFKSVIKFTTENREIIEDSNAKQTHRTKKKDGQEASSGPKYLHGFFNYFRNMAKGLGLISILLSIVSLTQVKSVLLRRPPLLFFLYTVIFITVSILIRPGNIDVRHQIVIYPFISIFAASSLEFFHNKGRYFWVAFILLSIAFLSKQSLDIVMENIRLQNKDTRLVAKEWVEENIPKGAKILLGENGPPLRPNEATIQRAVERLADQESDSQFTKHYGKYLDYHLQATKNHITYDIFEIRYPWWRDAEIKSGVATYDSEYDKDMGNPVKQVGVHTYNYYVENDFDYVIVHSDAYKRYFKNGSSVQEDFPSFTTFYRTLFEEGDLIKEFIPSDPKSEAPTVKIFRVSG